MGLLAELKSKKKAAKAALLNKKGQISDLMDGPDEGDLAGASAVELGLPVACESPVESPVVDATHGPTLSVTDISSMSVKRLKEELAHRGLPTHGLKPVLVERLQQADGVKVALGESKPGVVLLDEGDSLSEEAVKGESDWEYEEEK